MRESLKKRKKGYQKKQNIKEKEKSAQIRHE